VVRPNSPISRRHFLIGTAGTLGGAVLLGACGGDPTSNSTNPQSDQPSSGQAGSEEASTAVSESLPANGFVVVQRYPSGQAITPGEVRLAVSLADSTGSLLREGPATLTGSIRNEAGETIAAISAPRRGTGLDVPYWSITASIPARGLYEFVLDGAAGDPTPFLLFDSSEISFPTVGTALPPFDTPTIDDARGVDPICTRLDGACPFHEVTLADALTLGKPVVYLVGTPAHCTTATCGPGLDFLIDAAADYADVATFVHAEVYSNPEGTEVAPAVTALTLNYEPVIFVTDASGTVTRRIDIVWDADELAVMLAAGLA
jgi:hypothetical protein